MIGDQAFGDQIFNTVLPTQNHKVRQKPVIINTKEQKMLNRKSKQIIYLLRNMIEIDDRL